MFLEGGNGMSKLPELKPICVLPDDCRRDLKEALAHLEAVQDIVLGISSAAGEAVAAAAARIRQILTDAGADEEERCPECGSTEFYATHCLECGAAINPEHEECWVPPEALRAEMAGDIEKAIRIMQGRGRRAR